ncbi:MAG: XRE family transcriptional regulator, partial [Actinomycetia bacterium]|nr:XRE family transcriptional regulator [Actinomycetes bacterium]
VRDRAGVLPAIAGGVGVQDRGAATVEITLARRLSGQRVLLVLDNFEQVLPAAKKIVDLLDGSRDLRVVVTSRAPLQVPGEQL